MWYNCWRTRMSSTTRTTTKKSSTFPKNVAGSRVRWSQKRLTYENCDKNRLNLWILYFKTDFFVLFYYFYHASAAQKWCFLIKTFQEENMVINFVLESNWNQVATPADICDYNYDMFYVLVLLGLQQTGRAKVFMWGGGLWIVEFRTHLLLEPILCPIFCHMEEFNDLENAKLVH